MRTCNVIETCQTASLLCILFIVCKQFVRQVGKFVLICLLGMREYHPASELAVVPCLHKLVVAGTLFLVLGLR